MKGIQSKNSFLQKNTTHFVKYKKESIRLRSKIDVENLFQGDCELGPFFEFVVKVDQALSGNARPLVCAAIDVER
jgi:hypothetical protein